MIPLIHFVSAVACHGDLAAFLAMKAPIHAAMIGGIDSTPNTTIPSGNRFPTP
ncbi:MAG: hypothetical protein WCH75_26660 [Candidatus Binatia bacterium]